MPTSVRLNQYQSLRWYSRAQTPLCLALYDSMTLVGVWTELIGNTVLFLWRAMVIRRKDAEAGADADAETQMTDWFWRRGKQYGRILDAI